jgi:hypothetical protein
MYNLLRDAVVLNGKDLLDVTQYPTERTLRAIY